MFCSRRSAPEQTARNILEMHREDAAEAGDIHIEGTSRRDEHSTHPTSATNPDYYVQISGH